MHQDGLGMLAQPLKATPTPKAKLTRAFLFASTATTQPANSLYRKSKAYIGQAEIKPFVASQSKYSSK
jgi:hypothetical protein